MMQPDCCCCSCRRRRGRRWPWRRRPHPSQPQPAAARLQARWPPRHRGRRGLGRTLRLSASAHPHKQPPRSPLLRAWFGRGKKEASRSSRSAAAGRTARRLGAARGYERRHQQKTAPLGLTNAYARSAERPKEEAAEGVATGVAAGAGAAAVTVGVAAAVVAAAVVAGVLVPTAAAGIVSFREEPPLICFVPTPLPLVWRRRV